MKKLVLLLVLMLAIANVSNAQQDTMYIMKSGAVVGQYDVYTELDSVIFYKPDIEEVVPNDTTYLDIATSVVGADDYTSGWWTAFSDYFTIPTDQLLYLEFINHNGGSENNWNNWNLVVANEVPDRDGDGYAESFVIRSDAYGWGNDDYDGSRISHNYPDWSEFRSIMDGATVTLEIDHSITGNVFITATAVGTDNTEMVMTYEQPVSATEDITAFLVADGSYMELTEAYLIPSKVTELEDFEPELIEISNAPATLEIGDDNYWADAVATVTFADGSSAVVDSLDLSFTVIGDISELGEKTVLVSYSKTLLGEYTQAVSTMYTLEVTNPIVSIAVTTLPKIQTYAFYGTDPIIFDPTGMVVTATFSDESTEVLDNALLEFGAIPLSAGEQTIDVSYEGVTSTISTTCALTLIEGVSQVGATDLSSNFWADHSDDYTVLSNESESITFYTYSLQGENYHCPIVILRNADYANNNTEYAAARMDNAGWVSGFDSATASHDWDMEEFKSNISGSKVVLTVTNNGDDTADLRFDVTYANGETHFQLYEGITVNSSDLTFALTVEKCYHVLVGE